jgi:phosphatidylserine decarboxylase
MYNIDMVINNFSYNKSVVKYLCLSITFILIGIIIHPISLTLFFLLLSSGIGSALLFVLLFRSPERHAIYIKNCFYSPCDGIVLRVKTIKPDPSILAAGQDFLCISIKSSFVDSYIRRSPINGEIESSLSLTRENKIFTNLDIQKDNVKIINKFKSDCGFTITTVDSFDSLLFLSMEFNTYYYSFSVGDIVTTGQTTGIVSFGSIIHIYFPLSCSARVVPGQRVFAGETMIAKYYSDKKTGQELIVNESL